MNSRRLWNSHQRHKFLSAEASGDILKIRVSEMAFPGFSRGIFHRGRHVVSLEYTGNNAIEMSQAFQDIARFERFTDLNMLEYAFNVIQNWETDSLQFYSMVHIFC